MVYLFLVDRPGDIGELRDGRQYVSRSQDEQVVIEGDHRLWTWQELLKSPAFWSIGLIFGSMVCVFTAVMLHLFGHLLDLGLKTSEAAIILSITATFGALGKPLIGWLSDRFGARFTIWLGQYLRLSRCCFLPKRRLFGAQHWRPVFMGSGIRGCPHCVRLRFPPASAANLRRWCRDLARGRIAFCIGRVPSGGLHL